MLITIAFSSAIPSSLSDSDVSSLIVKFYNLKISCTTIKHKEKTEK